ncbi:MAG TPA: DUF6263 family protein [Puia sp.]|nr:DUF6263 family protein [Puia sp.]
MKKYNSLSLACQLAPRCLACLICLAAVSCKTRPGADRQYAAGDENGIYRLRLNPANGSKYHYEISNESEFKLEINDKKVDNQSRRDVGVYYQVTKDTAGNFILAIRYDKIHIYTKQNDAETEMDAANAANSLEPAEKMLGLLTGAELVATVTPLGEVKSVNGYKELESKIMAGFDERDTYGKAKAQGQWDKLVGEELIGRNMDQLFKIFPDSAVHVGDKWSLNSRQKGEIGINSRTSYTLQEIHNETAVIVSEGELTSDSTATMMGYNVTTDLKGRQKGEYQMEARSGMLKSATITADIEGTITAAGKEIPVVIKSSVKLKSR